MRQGSTGAALRQSSGNMVDVTNLRQSVDGRQFRVCADVQGEPLWFESGDAPLQPRAEAFGCAVLPAAVARRADLVLEAPLDAVWGANVRTLQETWRQWWHIRKARIYPHTEQKRPFTKAKGIALCFSGGVDSFYSLLRSGLTFDHLVFAHGYDIKLSDSGRAAAVEQSLREVAAAVGARAVVIRTNLREHPAFGATSWERIHGGALAALGHLLGGEVGSLGISASYPYYHEAQWGSHWRTDPLWSSAQLEIVHCGAWLWRKEKLELIAGEELVRRHLRVCWENRNARSNCGHCEKCVRTMLILAHVHQLEQFPTFDVGPHLVERIGALPRVPSFLFPNYREFLQESTDPQVTEALQALLQRSQSRVPDLRQRMGKLVQRFEDILGHWSHRRDVPLKRARDKQGRSGGGPKVDARLESGCPRPRGKIETIRRL
jgi:hypothetical protein